MGDKVLEVAVELEGVVGGGYGEFLDFGEVLWGGGGERVLDWRQF